MEGISMARIKCFKNGFRISGRNADKVLRKILMAPPIDFEKEIKKADEMVFPGYSEKSNEQRRKLGKL